ncbi:MAG: hypothetical protein OSJ53_02785 [Kineothrix sp.]|nr:hypothetical protein [Kineothrix sp.]
MKNHKEYISYVGGILFNDQIYFSNGGFNGLFSVDIHDLSMQFIGRIPFLEKAIQKAYLGHVNCCYGSKIMLFPANCNQILVYDIDKNNMWGIPINSVDGSNVYMTAGVVCYDEQVYIFPTRLSQGIFMLDLKTLKIERNRDIEDLLDGTEFIYNIDNVIRINEAEIAILSGNTTIIGISIQEKKRTFCKQFTEDYNIWGIRYDGNNFWILSFTSTDVYEWDRTTDGLIKYQLEKEEWFSGKTVPYVNMIFIDDKAIVLPLGLKYIMQIDKTKRTISKAIDYPAGFRFLEGLEEWTAFGAFNVIEQHKVLIHPARGNMLLLYDVVNNHIEGKELTVNNDSIPYLKEIIERKFCQNRVVNEMDNLGVELLDLAINQERKHKNAEKTESAGKKIYQTLVGN